MRRLGTEPVDSLFIGVKALRHAAFDDGGVVGVGHHRALRAGGVRMPDHGEQRLRLRLAVDDPVGVEDLVAAVLGVRLGEHGELGVGRVAPHRAVGLLQVLDLLVAQREAQALVRLAQRAHRHPGELSRRHPLEELRRLVERAQHRLRHAIVQQRCDVGAAGIREINRAALDAGDRREAAVVRDVGGLGRPGRERAQPRHHQEDFALRRRRERRAVVQQALQALALERLQRSLGLDEVAQLGLQRAQAGIDFLQRCPKLREAELRQRTRAAELEDWKH
jgi:hypothetical protein